MKLLIVDDEHYFREALIKTAPWDQLGIEVCGEAENGVEALELVKQLHPEIILADINMPKMDGLVFVEKVKMYNSLIKIIFISGYDDFKYAKKAISLGVEDYLLKPINETELRNALKTVIQKSKNEKNASHQIKMLEDETQKNLGIKRQHYLSQLLVPHSEEGNLNILNKLEMTGDTFLGKSRFFVIVGEIDNSWDMKFEEHDLWNFTVINVLTEKLLTFTRFEQWIDNNRNMVFICEDNGEKNREEILSKLAEAQCDLKTYFGFTVSFGVGKSYESIHSLNISYMEAKKVLENKLFDDKETILEIHKSNHRYENYVIPTQIKMKLQLLLKERNKNEIENILDELFEDVKSKNISIDRFRIMIIELLVPCIGFLEGRQISHIDMFDEVSNKRKFGELKRYVYDLYRSFCMMEEVSEEKKLPDNVVNVIRIIEEKYQDTELNVDVISKEIFVNYNYLCVIFKRFLNITINDYILKYRMQKAIELFNSGSKQVTEVAELVGYSNVGYFTKCFRKEFGLTPSKYIISIQPQK